MSEQKMREALEHVRRAAHINDYGDWALDCGFDMNIVDEALAQQPAAAVELTDAEIVEVMRDGNGCRENDWQDHIDFARAVIAAHEAKKNGGGV